MARSPRLILQTSAQGAVGELFIYVRKKGRKKVGGTMMPLRGAHSAHPAIRVTIIYEIALLTSSLETSWPDCIAVSVTKVETDTSGFREEVTRYWVSLDKGETFEVHERYDTEDLILKQSMRFM